MLGGTGCLEGSAVMETLESLVNRVIGRKLFRAATASALGIVRSLNEALERCNDGTLRRERKGSGPGIVCKRARGVGTRNLGVCFQVCVLPQSRVTYSNAVTARTRDSFSHASRHAFYTSNYLERGVHSDKLLYRHGAM